MKTSTTSIRSNIVTRALGTLALMGVCSLSILTQARAQTPYIQTATSTNSLGDWTDLTVTDAHHASVYFVTANWNPFGNSGIYNNHPTGVWFDSGRSDWAIFNEDQTAIPADASFNVLSVPAGENVYTHKATAKNSTGDSTILDNVYANGNPNALIWVTPNWNPNDKGGVYANHNIGVWYDGSNWLIFNQDGTAIPVGAAFNVIVASGPFYPSTFVQTATKANSKGDYTIINDSLVNGANGHLLMVTPNWNPGGAGGVYNNHAIGVWYDAAAKKYAIFNQDGAAIPGGASFNVWVLK